MLNQNLGVIERLTSPTPSIFRTIRNISLVLAAIGASIAQLQAQMELPDWLLFAGDKSVWISGLLTALVSQLTVDYTTKAIVDATSEKAEKGYLR